MQHQSGHCPRCLGKMCSEQDQATLVRLESLEHWSNQQDILLTGLMKTMYNLGGSEIKSKPTEDI